MSTLTELTAQERQVAGLVRQGLSNRDAAARLFVSPRTLDFPPRNVFSKPGVAPPACRSSCDRRTPAPADRAAAAATSSSPSACADDLGALTGHNPGGESGD